MPTVLIRCPKTGDLVETSMFTDKRSFEASTITNYTSLCSACGDTHTWGKADVAPETWTRLQ